ncbi:hypothetical protein BDW02DRAFT_386471 [Decorospora gaudefroyi]|uniref:Uncharacterized protein n=1 Tax=Decorospora gaudefroyi TaxID=184978 RepID=A0A6A5KBI3_9PLEO|nr:hypothetical protein BDW02DRAFT_386471 [Decorospora gaudefroyi]
MLPLPKQPKKAGFKGAWRFTSYLHTFTFSLVNARQQSDISGMRTDVSIPYPTVPLAKRCEVSLRSTPFVMNRAGGLFVVLQGILTDL